MRPVCAMKREILMLAFSTKLLSKFGCEFISGLITVVLDGCMQNSTTDTSHVMYKIKNPVLFLNGQWK